MAKVSRPFDHSTTDFEQAHPRFSPLLSIYSKSYVSIFLPQQIMLNKPQLQLRSNERKAARDEKKILLAKYEHKHTPETAFLYRYEHFPVTPNLCPMSNVPGQ